MECGRHFFAFLVVLVCSSRVAALRKQTNATADVNATAYGDDSAPCDQFPPLAPTLCPQGNALWSKQEMRAAIPGFVDAYKRRPILDNQNGIKTNHAFALWFTIKQLKPKHIIESGVYVGGSTWLMRQAAGPNTAIYSFDPRPQSDLTYKEDHYRIPGRYFMGKDFRDIGQMSWDHLIPRNERERTLVFLDDHMASTRRAKELLKAGFIHIFYEDNFSRKSAEKRSAGCYSFNAVCSPVPSTEFSVLFQDHFGSTRKRITLKEHSANVDFLKEHIETYFEFPPLYDACRPFQSGQLLTKEQFLGFGMLLGDAKGTSNPPYVQLKRR